MRRLTLRLMPLALALAAASALAIPSGHKWFSTNPPVPYRVFAHTTINGMPANSFSTQVNGHGPILGQVENAFATWTCLSASNCRVQGTTWASAFTATFSTPTGNAAVSGTDGQNSVLWEGGTDWRYAAATLGLTTTLYYQGSGQIIDADMELNNNVAWDDLGAAAAYDYPSVVLHEAGHFLGLDHTPNSIAVMYATVAMGPSGTKRVLAAPDISDVTTVYPANVDGGSAVLGAQGDACTSGAGCSAGLACRGDAMGGGTICTIDCTSGATCPAGLTCQTANTGKACLVPASGTDYFKLCTDGSDCASGFCVGDGVGHNWCTAECNNTTPCQTGSSCLDVDSAGACSSSSTQCVCAPANALCPGQCTGTTCTTPGYACIDTTCAATGGEGDRCEASGLCQQCMICIGDTSAAYCRLCCGGDTTDCPSCVAAECSDTDECDMVNGATDSVCVPAGGADTCESCGTGNACNDGEVCLGGLCHASCDPTTPGTCIACAAQSSVQGLCVCNSSEISAEGQPCGVSTSVQACNSGLVCNNGLCARQCVVGEAGVCPTGQECRETNGLASCVDSAAGMTCAVCDGTTCLGAGYCFQGRCYETCNITVKGGPCDSACIDIGGGKNLCACDDQIGGIGSYCGSNPIGGCSTGLYCAGSSCEGPCTPNVTACPIGTLCEPEANADGVYVCQPIDYSTGGGSESNGGGGGQLSTGGGSGGSGGNTGGGNAGCGCGSSDGSVLAFAFAALLLRRRRRD